MHLRNLNLVEGRIEEASRARSHRAPVGIAPDLGVNADPGLMQQEPRAELGSVKVSLLLQMGPETTGPSGLGSGDPCLVRSGRAPLFPLWAQDSSCGVGDAPWTSGSLSRCFFSRVLWCPMPSTVPS